MFDFLKSKKTGSKRPIRRVDRARRPSRTEERAKLEGRKRAIKIATFFVVPMIVIGLAYPYINVMTQMVKPDGDTYCYQNMPDQKHTASFIDYSTTNLFSDPAQMRALKIGAMEAYSLMSPNQRLDVFTTAKDTSSGIASPIYTICKPASTAAQYAVMKQHEPNMPDMSQAQLTYEADKAQEAFIQKIDTLIVKSQAKKASGEDWDAPLFQTFKSISRYYQARGEHIDHLINYSAGIVATRDVFWCRNQHDLPSWANFKKRPIYQSVKPFKSFHGMKVTFLMPNILERYYQGKWCSVDEIKVFWQSYFLEAGAGAVDIQPLNYRVATVKQQDEREG